MSSSSRLVAMACVLGLAWQARASSTYPTWIKEQLSAPTEPAGSCFICHRGGTGTGTVNTSFGRNMRMVGMLTGMGTREVLNNALANLETAGTSSANDGVTDIRKLRDGLNPNLRIGAGGAGELPPIGYGCGAEVTPVAAGALTSLALWLLRRRRR